MIEVCFCEKVHFYFYTHTTASMPPTPPDFFSLSSIPSHQSIYKIRTKKTHTNLNHKLNIHDFNQIRFKKKTLREIISFCRLQLAFFLSELLYALLFLLLYALLQGSVQWQLPSRDIPARW